VRSSGGWRGTEVYETAAGCWIAPNEGLVAREQCGPVVTEFCKVGETGEHRRVAEPGDELQVHTLLEMPQLQRQADLLLEQVCAAHHLHVVVLLGGTGMQRDDQQPDPAEGAHSRSSFFR
jgi:hypothetical protein